MVYGYDSKRHNLESEFYRRARVKAKITPKKGDKHNWEIN